MAIQVSNLIHLQFQGHKLLGSSADAPHMLSRGHTPRVIHANAPLTCINLHPPTHTYTHVYTRRTAHDWKFDNEDSNSYINSKWNPGEPNGWRNCGSVLLTLFYFTLICKQPRRLSCSTITLPLLSGATAEHLSGLYTLVAEVLTH